MNAREMDQHDIDLVDELTGSLLHGESLVRGDVVAAARARLADGPQPTALDLAGTLVAHFA